MKQINTIIKPIERLAEFDADVNALLAEGWTLKKRETMKATGMLSDAYNAPIITLLYAEMERDVPPWPEEITE